MNQFHSNLSRMYVRDISSHYRPSGISGATWKDFPEKTKNVVTKALMEFGNEMTSQEVSNFIYG